MGRPVRREFRRENTVWRAERGAWSREGRAVLDSARGARGDGFGIKIRFARRRCGGHGRSELHRFLSGIKRHFVSQIAFVKQSVRRAHQRKECVRQRPILCVKSLKKRRFSTFWQRFVGVGGTQKRKGVLRLDRRDARMIKKQSKRVAAVFVMLAQVASGGQQGNQIVELVNDRVHQGRSALRVHGFGVAVRPKELNGGPVAGVNGQINESLVFSAAQQRMLWLEQDARARDFPSAKEVGQFVEQKGRRSSFHEVKSQSRLERRGAVAEPRVSESLFTEGLGSSKDPFTERRRSLETMACKANASKRAKALGLVFCSTRFRCRSKSWSGMASNRALAQCVVFIPNA